MPALNCWPATSTSTTPLCWADKWHAQYARPEQPFVLELGCGKGGFLSQLACAHPENNYLGIDITDKVLILAKRKVEAAYQAADRPIDNVKIMSADIERIHNVIFPEDTVRRVYINFCNPWSKNGSSQQAPPHLPPPAHPVPGIP